MFRSIVVPLDREANGDRALPVAGSLARLGGLPVELVTISSPRMAGFVEPYELGRRAREYGLGSHSINVLYDDDAGRAITGFLETNDEALVVMGSSAKGTLGELVFGSVSEYVLAHAHRPVVIVGPEVDPTRWTGTPVLVVAVDESDATDAALPVIESWQHTFGGKAVRVVEVAPIAISVGATLPESPGAAPVMYGEPDGAKRYATLLGERGVAASPKVFYGGDPAARLEELDLDDGDAVLVATSANWTTTGVHWHGMTRQIARRSTYPVLVVPAG